MTKSIKRNKTFKSKKYRKNTKNLKGGSTQYASAPNPYHNSLNLNPLLLLLKQLEVCGNNSQFILNHEDVINLHTYINKNYKVILDSNRFWLASANTSEKITNDVNAIRIFNQINVIFDQHLNPKLNCKYII